MATERNFNVVTPPNALQASLSYLFDSGAGVFRPIQRQDLRSTGSLYISNSTASGDFGTCLQANVNRKMLFIKNLAADGALFVKYGVGVSDTSFNHLLKTDDATNNGNGGELKDEIWKGAVSCSGVGTTNYLAWEL